MPEKDKCSSCICNRKRKLQGKNSTESILNRWKQCKCERVVKRQIKDSVE